MSVYVPATMLGYAALNLWNNIGKDLTALEQADRVLECLREPDMELIKRVAERVGVSVPMTELTWNLMIDFIRAERVLEQVALDAFEATGWSPEAKL